MPRIDYRAFLLALACTAAGLAPSQVLAQTAYGVTAAGQLIRFDLTTPGTVNLLTSITGLGGGESILGIDFRPVNGQLIGLGSQNRMYTIDTGNGAVTVIGTHCGCTLSGTSFGFDVNPVVD